MEFLKVLKRKKLLFLNIFFLLYISINLFTGERGLISYFEKKTLLSNLNNEKGLLLMNCKVWKIKTIYYLIFKAMI